MFTSKGVAYPNGSNFNCECGKLAFSRNIRLKLLRAIVTNTLAYYIPILIAALTCFIMEGLRFIRLEELFAKIFSLIKKENPVTAIKLLQL